MEKLNGEALRTIDEIVARHKNQAGPCIEMLHEVQNELGYIPFEAMEKIAEATVRSSQQNRRASTLSMYVSVRHVMSKAHSS